MRIELETHLEPLKKKLLFNTWHRGMAAAGMEEDEALHEHCGTAAVILLLTSPNFMASEDYNGPKMQKLMDRYKKKEALIIPILWKPASLDGAPFARLKSLPSDNKHIADRRDQNKALVSIVEDIERSLEQIQKWREIQLSDQRDSDDKKLIHQGFIEARGRDNASSMIESAPERRYKIDKSFIVAFNLDPQHEKFLRILREQLEERYYGALACSTTAGDYSIFKKYILQRMILELQRRNRRKSIILDEVFLMPADLSESEKDTGGIGGIERSVLSRFNLTSLAGLFEIENTHDDIILVLWHGDCPTRLVQSPARAFEARLKEQAQNILREQKRCLLIFWATNRKSALNTVPNKNITLPMFEKFNVEALTEFSSKELKEQLEAQGAAENTINQYLDGLKNKIARDKGHPIGTYQKLEEFIATI